MNIVSKKNILTFIVNKNKKSYFNQLLEIKLKKKILSYP